MKYNIYSNYLNKLSNSRLVFKSRYPGIGRTLTQSRDFRTKMQPRSPDFQFRDWNPNTDTHANDPIDCSSGPPRWSVNIPQRNAALQANVKMHTESSECISTAPASPVTCAVGIETEERGNGMRMCKDNADESEAGCRWCCCVKPRPDICPHGTSAAGHPENHHREHLPLVGVTIQNCSIGVRVRVTFRVRDTV